MLPSITSKLVYLSMISDPDAFLYPQMDTNGILHKAQEFVYSNGKDQPPTAINIDKGLLRGLMFNQSPSKVSQFLVTGYHLQVT
jgi:hypothetical protein